MLFKKNRITSDRVKAIIQELPGMVGSSCESAFQFITNTDSYKSLDHSILAIEIELFISFRLDFIASAEGLGPDSEMRQWLASLTTIWGYNYANHSEEQADDRFRFYNRMLRIARPSDAKAFILNVYNSFFGLLNWALAVDDTMASISVAKNEIIPPGGLEVYKYSLALEEIFIPLLQDVKTVSCVMQQTTKP